MILFPKLLVAVAFTTSVLLTGCDSTDDGGIKTISKYHDLTPPPFSDIVSSKSDIAYQWIKKDAFGQEQYRVIKTVKSPDGCKSGHYYYIADMREKTVQPLMSALCLSDNITLSFKEETDNYTGEKSVIYSHDGKEMGKIYMPKNQEDNQ